MTRRLKSRLGRPILGMLAGAALAAGLCACSKPPDTPGPASEPAASSEPAEMQDLRAIPYAEGASSEEEGDGVVFRDPSRSAPGYTLYTSQKLCSATLLKDDGEPVRTWKAPGGGQSWANAELLASGDLLVTGADADPGGLDDEKRYLMRLNWQGQVVWRKDITAHHDVDVTPSGDIIVLSFERRLLEAIHPRVPTRDDHLTLLKPDGEVIESLSLYDILSKQPEQFPLEPVKVTKTPNGGWIDLFHCNSVERFRQRHLLGNHAIYDADNVLVCSRHQSRVFVINWKRRELVWAWGKGELDGPHDATMLANGHLLIFDNGLHRKWSRVIELDPVRQEIVWQYKATPPSDFYTASKGSNQRLAGGTTLICNSDNAEAFEVTPEGEIVWRFLNPLRLPNGDRATIVRLYRYDQAFIEAIAKAAGAP